VYNAFYGLEANPFNQTPDPRFFFPSHHHQSAVSALMFAILQNKGFVVITGEIGSGKTTVVRAVLKKLGGKFKCGLITNTHLTPKGVLTLILEDLGVAYRDGPKEKLLIQFTDYLIQQAAEDCTVVLIVDEAQNLSPRCLEELRMLSNLETEQEKLIQIALVGQPELRQKLAMKGLEQLRQRVAVHYHIQCLNLAETKDYILHRLNFVKANGRDMHSIFEIATYDRIFKFSRGLPRLINLVCDHLLLTGCLAKKQVITADLADEVVSEIRFGEGVSRHE